MLQQQGFLTINQGQLYYQIAGTGDPLVLIHGDLTDSRMWSGQLEALAQQYTVVCYDRRGFGRSASALESYVASDDLSLLLQALNVGPAHLVGHSGGGALALDFALAYPDQVSSLSLFATGISGYNWSNLETYATQMGVYHEQGKIAEMADLALQTWTIGPHRRPNDIDDHLLNQIRIFHLDQFARPLPWTHEIPLEPPVIDRLSRIEKPALVLIGEQDHSELLHISDYLLSELSGATRVVLAGGAHMINMEKPDQFNKTILDFLQLQ